MLVNGEFGVYMVGLFGVDGYWVMVLWIIVIIVCDGKVCVLWDIVNFDKFIGFLLKECWV